jgi:hypothetical protein
VNHTTRREFLKDAALAGAAVSTSAPRSLFAAAPAQSPASAVAPRSIALSLVGGQPTAMATGISWGVPFAQGAVRPDTAFSLSANGSTLPLQSWPLAYWPDGSLKWSGFATVAPAGLAGQLTLVPGAAQAGASGTLKVTNTARAITVDTGALQCSIPTTGANLIDSITLGG